MIRHNNVFVKLELPGIAILNERGDHEFGNFVTLKQIPLQVCTDRDEVSRHKSSGLKPLGVSMLFRNANLKVRSTVYLHHFTT